MSTIATLKSDAVAQLGQSISSGEVDTAILNSCVSVSWESFNSRHRWKFNEEAGTATTLTTPSVIGDYVGAITPQSGTLDKAFTPLAWSNAGSYRDNSIIFVDRSMLAIPTTETLFSYDRTTGSIISNKGGLAVRCLCQIIRPLPGDSSDLPLSGREYEALLSMVIGRYWLATERASGKHSSFMSDADNIIDEVIAKDNASRGITLIQNTSVRRR